MRYTVNMMIGEMIENAEVKPMWAVTMSDNTPVDNKRFATEAEARLEMERQVAADVEFNTPKPKSEESKKMESRVVRTYTNPKSGNVIEVWYSPKRDRFFLKRDGLCMGEDHYTMGGIEVTMNAGYKKAGVTPIINKIEM